MIVGTLLHCLFLLAPETVLTVSQSSFVVMFGLANVDELVFVIIRAVIAFAASILLRRISLFRFLSSAFMFGVTKYGSRLDVETVFVG